MVARLEQPGPGTTGLPAGGNTDQVLAKTSPADYDADWVTPSGGGGAPTTADYLVGTANGTLSAEIVVGTSPGGELGGTWASPTVDATHSGSSHAAVQAAAEATAANATNLTSGTVADARIASTIARDSEVTTAVAGEATARDAAIVTERSTAATLTNKTLTAPVVNSPTGIVKGDVGLGNVDNTSNATERAATATLTNKTLTSPTITGGTITGITDLTVTDGGTGVSTLAAHGLVVGNGASAVALVGPDASTTKLLQAAGSGADPAFVALSGDATVAAGGAVTLKNTGPGATGPIGDATHSSAVTIDAQGRVTALTSVAITGAADKLGLTPTAVKTATTYTAAVGDFVPCDTTSNAITVTLPTAPADGSVIAVKLVIQGGTNAVTITCGGSDVFNKAGGSTSGTITLLNEAYIFQYKSSSAIWYLVLTDTPATAALLTKIGGAPLASPTFTGTVTIPTGGSITAPTGLVKGDVGLGNVDNTSDATKNAASVTLTNKTLTSPVVNTGISGTAIDIDSTMAANSDTLLASQKAIKTADALKANLASPTFTGTVTLPASTALTTPVLTSPTGLAVPRAAVVASIVTHTQSNTTLSDVTGLLVPIGASATEVWFFEAFLLIAAANTTVDYKLGFTVPASCTMAWGATGTPAVNISGFGINLSSGTPIVITTAAATVIGGSTNGTVGAGIAGYIFGGGTGGNVQLQFAQNTSDASNLSVLAGSMLRYTKLVA